MSRTHYYTASSLDGFIATTDHSLDWLFVQDIDREGPMAYDEFFIGIGAIAMGASTYSWILERTTWTYEVPAWVFTHRSFPEPPGDVRFTTDAVHKVHAEMTAAADGKDLWIVGGGDLVGQFADEGLLDEVWIQYAPVTLGSGAPLLPRRLDLEVMDIARNRNFACTRYAVRK
jgi:dihydrofolate reductase